MMIDLPVPPKDLRLWVGPFEDERLFLELGGETVSLMESMGKLRSKDSVLDVGCGSGRVALALANVLSPKGRYTGFDVGLPPIRWCQENIQSRYPNFHFSHIDVRHPGYNPEGRLSPEQVRFPVETESVDLAVLSSIFTHLLPSAVQAYTREIARVLRSGGRSLISFLLMNKAAEQAVINGTTIFDFGTWLGPCATFAPDEPTKGVAYLEDYAFGVLQTNGLQVEAVCYGNWRNFRSYEIEHDWVAVVKRL